MGTQKINLTSLKGKIIAIDGPAGSGKSTTSKMLAERLGYTYLDTGAMYRALTYFALKNNISPADGEKLTTVANNIPIEFKQVNEKNHIFINGEDVTTEIRSRDVTKNASEVAAHKGVREAMVKRQKEIGKQGSIVAEGRDTTTVVFPHADIKIYLTASVKDRAQRRFLELIKSGVSTTVEEIEADITKRDEFDSNREHSPLMKSHDAIVVDTSNMTIEGQVDHIVSLMRSILK